MVISTIFYHGTKSSFQYLMEQVYQKEKKCLWIKKLLSRNEVDQRQWCQRKLSPDESYHIISTQLNMHLLATMETFEKPFQKMSWTVHLNLKTSKEDTND